MDSAILFNLTSLLFTKLQIMTSNSSKREISSNFKPNNRSTSVTSMTDDSIPVNVEPLSSEPWTDITITTWFSSWQPLCLFVQYAGGETGWHKGNIPTCIKKSTQSTRQHVLLRPKSKILKTKASIAYLIHTETLIDIALTSVSYKTLGSNLTVDLDK